ncbi:MAG TPA: tRNA isopentenyl-2-thiomethyl-A-37 hydroxylase MiaE [Bryobacteraceae bacterium]|nr:tRNA isopentenyl-2-thiomethyl-A-37 hydroxylase MiaE [Bryobacteraceae bacterium]
MPVDLEEKIKTLPLRTRTPLAWGSVAMADPIALLIDHAFLEMKAAQNAMELMTRWPNEWTPGWVETMTSVARDETAHLSQVTRILMRRGGRMERGHKSFYAAALRALVRAGQSGETLDRLCVSALIEARSCERFFVLANTTGDEELRNFYKALFSSELGHYKVFLRLAHKMAPQAEVKMRWEQMLDHEARIISEQEPGSRIHSGVPAV